jgi:hypothetical protein
MIRIDNLTEYQVEMLDHMWSLDSDDEFFTWFELLEPKDQELAQSLQRMVILATVDELVEVTHLKEAQQVLKRFALQK